MIIDDRFNGPPNSGNGGYVAGLLAKEMGGTVQVTLLKPPPLNENMELISTEESYTLMKNNQIIAKAVPSSVTIQPPVKRFIDIKCIQNIMRYDLSVKRSDK